MKLFNYYFKRKIGWTTVAAVIVAYSAYVDENSSLNLIQIIIQYTMGALFLVPALDFIVGRMLFGLLRDAGSSTSEIFADLGTQLRDIKCCWCGKDEKQNFINGKQSDRYWKYQNKDGSPDKRKKDNYQLCSYLSIYECGFCSAKNGYCTSPMQDPSEKTKVVLGINVKEGKEQGKRKGKNFGLDNINEKSILMLLSKI